MSESFGDKRSTRSILIKFFFYVNFGKLLSGPVIETMVWKKLYMAKGGGLRAQKQCDLKPLLTAPQSRDHIVSNLRASCGRPLGTKRHPYIEVSFNK
jgi:hypothetical protein